MFTMGLPTGRRFSVFLSVVFMEGRYKTDRVYGTAVVAGTKIVSKAFARCVYRIPSYKSVPSMGLMAIAIPLVFDN